MNKKSFSIDHDDEDFEFDFDSPRRKPVIRKGRRSDNSLTSNLSSAGVLTNDRQMSLGAVSPSESHTASMPYTRSKKTGGWAEDTSSSKMNWLRRVSRSSPSKETPKEEVKAAPDSDTEIPSIPDLDDVYQEEFSAQVAHAPSVTVNRVLTYQELDNDLTRNAAFQTLDGIDLRLLTKHLGPEHKIKEEDVPWIWDMLFTDVSSHIAETEEKIEAKSITDDYDK